MELKKRVGKWEVKTDMTIILFPFFDHMWWKKKKDGTFFLSITLFVAVVVGVKEKKKSRMLYHTRPSFSTPHRFSYFLISLPPEESMSVYNRYPT